MKDLFSKNIRNYDSYDDGTEGLYGPSQEMAVRHLLNLEGLVLDYYGADAGDNTFMVDDVVFKVLEDPNDGYRSLLGAVDYTDKHTSIFFRQAIARVRLETYDSGNDPDHYQVETFEEHGSYGVDQGYRLVDVDDGHVWLEFGTHNYDDYYPCFIFRHHPKAAPMSTPLGETCPEIRDMATPTGE
jgi:hypothetical protein